MKVNLYNNPSTANVESGDVENGEVSHNNEPIKISEIKKDHIENLVSEVKELTLDELKSARISCDPKWLWLYKQFVDKDQNNFLTLEQARMGTIASHGFFKNNYDIHKIKEHFSDEIEIVILDRNGLLIVQDGVKMAVALIQKYGTKQKIAPKILAHVIQVYSSERLLYTDYLPEQLLG